MAAILSSPILGLFGFGPKRNAKPAAERREPKLVDAAPVDEIPVPLPAPQLMPRAEPLDAERILAATRGSAVELAPIEWDGDKSVPRRADAAIEATATLDGDPRGPDAKSRRIRDRYRFVQR